MVDIGGEILCFPLLDDVNVLFVTLSEIFFLGGVFEMCIYMVYQSRQLARPPHMGSPFLYAISGNIVNIMKVI